MIYPVEDVHVSYEGEGDWLGKRTLFCQYRAKGEGTDIPNLFVQRPEVLYVLADKLDDKIIHFINVVNLPTTVEITQQEMLLGDAYEKFRQKVKPCCRFFVVYSYPDLNLRFNGFAKIRILSPDQWDECIGLANILANLGKEVLLMPECYDLSVPDEIVLLREKMMVSIDKLMPRVRLMPPVHRLIGIR